MREDFEIVPEDDDDQAVAGARLLLVSDDGWMGPALAQFLKREGYHVDTAAEGSEALALLGIGRYRLVLMEVKAGLKLIGAIGQGHPEVAVLVMTDYNMIERAQEAVRRGACTYLVWPIIDDEICGTIRTALRRQALVSENRQLRQELKLRTGMDRENRWERRRQNAHQRKPPGTVES